MYNYVLGFIGIVFGIVVGGLLISLLYPYPESKGYRDLARNIFIWIVPFFDLGVAYGIERFIGEWRVKDQAKMVQYIHFFIWYQLFNSLLKTTLFSIWAFDVISRGELAYLNWNLLLLAIQNYPGVLYTLRSCMAGLQQYRIANTLNTVGSEVLDKVFLLFFIFMWRNIGNQNPALGELNFSSCEGGVSECALEVSEKLKNPQKFLHGAVIYALADSGMGGTPYSLMNKDEICATVTITLNYLRSVKSGKVECKTHVTSKKDTMATLESDIINDDVIVAKAIGVYAITKFKP
jgi:acyl-CoA thioesterase